MDESAPGRQEDFEERAAILEYDSELSREEAEKQARLLLMPEAKKGAGFREFQEKFGGGKRRYRF